MAQRVAVMGCKQNFGRHCSDRRYCKSLVIYKLWTPSVRLTLEAGLHQTSGPFLPQNLWDMHQDIFKKVYYKKTSVSKNIIPSTALKFALPLNTRA